MSLALIALFPVRLLAADPLPERTITADDTVLTQSCRVVIDPALVIPDANNDGVLHIAADNITIEFAPGTILRGAPANTPWDTLTGIGIALDGHSGVTFRNLRIQGFKIGLRARSADGITIDTAEFADNYRRHLKSTPEHEDQSDWLFPHDNDDMQWATQHGAAIFLGQTDRATVRNVRVRRGQNGIILDLVDKSNIYDNDCSFLSGWGLAMWRSSENTISRNAFDFCVRGHSEGIYNRGQDSAGILCFEQCNKNVFVENSVTHGGDGFFAFGGKEAIGERRPDSADFYSTPHGCDANIFYGNDFSYAAAHGLELTFSHRNIIAANRFVENAICGIWGGYSRDTLIYKNTFVGNGGMAYGLERGAINIEHGSENTIARNTFTNNLCGIHLWWDDDGKLLELPGVKLTDAGVSRNIIAENTFEMNADHPFKDARHANAKMIAVQLRNVGGKGKTEGNVYAKNTVKLEVPNAVELDACTPFKGIDNHESFNLAAAIPEIPSLGTSNPVGARDALAGRANIIMDEWGPWDHESPMLRKLSSGDDQIVYEIRGVADPITATDLTTHAPLKLDAPTNVAEPTLLRVPLTPGFNQYKIQVKANNWSQLVLGSALRATWDCVFFPWDDATDPRKSLDAWRAHASTSLARIQRPAIDFNFANGGPADLPFAKSLDTSTWPGRDHFGTIARTKIHLPAGAWRFITTSDDGVRVLVNAKPIIENWTWHAPTRDEGTFTQPAEGDVEVVVEHFEIDGYATLKLEIEPAPKH